MSELRDAKTNGAIREINENLRICRDERLKLMDEVEVLKGMIDKHVARYERAEAALDEMRSIADGGHKGADAAESKAVALNKQLAKLREALVRCQEELAGARIDWKDSWERINASNVSLREALTKKDKRQGLLEKVAEQLRQVCKKHGSKCGCARCRSLRGLTALNAQEKP